MVRWLEREGYDVTYCTNIDTHFDRQLLLPHQAFFSVGHDEYWSWEMRENVENARNQGINLCFFSANTCYWQIRLGTSLITGDVNRTIIAYKEMIDLDPFGHDRDRSNDRKITTLWRKQPVNYPEDALIGVMYETFNVHGDIVIDQAPDWLLADTKLTKGDRLPGLLGYEVDRIFGNAPGNLIRIGHSPYSHKGGTRYSDMTLYYTPKGSLVFAVGSMQWSWGLDDYNAPLLRPSVLNPAVQTLTRNLMARILKRST